MVLRKKTGPSDFDSDYYYVDDDCLKLEGILRTRTEFSSCRIKRLSVVDTFGGNPPSSEDPFAVISGEESLMVWVYPWELEALSNPDNLLAYLTVESERTKIGDKYDYTILILGVLIIFMAFTLVTSILFSIGYILNSFQSGVIVVLVITSIGIAFAFYRTLKQKRNLLVDLDIRYARETTEFREALRILSNLSDRYDLMDITKYVRRHKTIEDALLSGS
ncbi:MAG: hypothetical protein JW779_00635 [Candidatus Thorarchaeota archaeon]|nr:hypothetical protein [Candidatus Thorarchaeota archaeon]